MAVELFMVRDTRTPRLAPATPHDLETLINSIPPGRDVRAVLTMPRNLRQHKFYWGLISKAAESHPHYRTAEALHLWLKIRMGNVESFTFHDGTCHLQAGSTAFAKMDNLGFKQHLDETISLLVSEVLPGVKRADLLREVHSMLGISYADVTKGVDA